MPVPMRMTVRMTESDALRLPAILLQPVPNLIPGHPQELRGLALVAAGALQRLAHEVALEFFHVQAVHGELEQPVDAAIAAHVEREREVALRERRSLAEDHRPLEHVAQLAHVARPRVVQQRIQGTVVDPLDLLVELAVELVDEELEENAELYRRLS